ncbi:hypothetical protein QBA54_29860 [Streptomyces sp. B21-108]|uniref:hypothetical protein n=1 Tax=Streptomyces sp. B21-108 TaxID=3039419 RepID=UPI002FF3012B
MTEGSGRCAAVPVVLDEETRGALQRIASSAKAQVRQVLRAHSAWRTTSSATPTPSSRSTGRPGPNSAPVA